MTFAASTLETTTIVRQEGQQNNIACKRGGCRRLKCLQVGSWLRAQSNWVLSGFLLRTQRESITGLAVDWNSNPLCVRCQDLHCSAALVVRLLACLALAVPGERPVAVRSRHRGFCEMLRKTPWIRALRHVPVVSAGVFGCYPVASGPSSGAHSITVGPVHLCVEASRLG